MKKNFIRLFMRFSKFTLYVILIKIVSIQLLLATVSDAQNIRKVKLSIEVQNASIEEVLEKIKSVTQFTFAYKDKIIKEKPERFTFQYEDEVLASILERIGKTTGLHFKQINQTISVLEVKNTKEERIFQVREIYGKISDEKGQPLPGATIAIKDGSVGTIADLEGNFRLKIPEETEVVVVSFVGYQTREISIQNTNEINVVLSVDTQALQEIVVIGYGEKQKDLLVANVEKLEAQAFEKQTNINANQAIQGRLPGVFVTNNSGAPGGNAQVVIRGLNSINAGNDPLYVVDGVPIVTGSLETNSNTGFTASNLDVLSLINPNDIASIEVLKDAAAKAIYGSRAANGAILITTKSNQGQGQHVSFSTQQGVSLAIIPFELLNSAQYTKLRTESYTNDGSEVPQEIRDIDTSVNTGWLDLVLRDARFQEYQFNLSKAGESLRYYLSASYRNEEGVIETNDLERTTIRFNLDVPLSKKIKFGTRTSMGFDKGNQMYSGYSPAAMGFFSAVTMPTHLTVKDENGEYNRSPYFFNPPNPVAVIREREYETKTYKLISNNHMVFDMTPFLTFRTDFSYDLTTYREDFLDTENTNTWLKDGLRSHNYVETVSYTVEPQLRFSQTWKKHNLEATLGGTIQQQDQFYERVAGNNFSNDNTTYLNSASNIISFAPFSGNRLTGSNVEGYSFSSFFGRASYDFAEKYLFTATFRRDGSSRFGPNTRYGNFWSLGGGWIFSRESFMEGIPFISFGKLRASYGVTGNDQIGNYPYIGYWESGRGFFGSPTLVASQLPNEDLKWEELHDFDIGIEFGLLDNRFHIEAGYFNALSKDLLLFRPLPYMTGFVDYFENIGSVRNKGLELDLKGTLIHENDWDWQVGVNFTWVENKVEELVGQDPIITDNTWSANIVGQPVNSFYNLVFEGVDVETGEPVFKDLNGDGQITLDDRDVIGNPNPRMFGGFYTSLRWKNFSLNANFSFVKDVNVYDIELTMNYRYLHRYAINARIEVLNRWQKPGDQTNMVRMTQANVLDAWNVAYIHDGSYIRMRNVTLSYQLPQKILSPAKISGASVYFTGVNLWTITRLEGIEPEQDGSGFNYYEYPQTRQLIMGLNIRF